MNISEAAPLPAPVAADPGRPSKRDARRRAFLDAAMQLFIEKGYGATSLSDVVGRSGGSLATLYDMFGNKAGLFRELIEDKCATLTAMFEETAVADIPPQQALTRFAHLLLALCGSGVAAAAYRLLIAEGPQNPELVTTFFASGPDAGRARMAAYLRSQAKRGLLEFEDAELAAERFCGMMFGDLDMRLACGLPLPAQFQPPNLERHIEEGVRAFLRAYAATKPV
jgi:AcrR family transcriptional regulator